MSFISNSYTYSHCLQVVLVTLTQFVGDHRFGFAHVIDAAFDRDDAFKIEIVDIVDTAYGYFGVGVLHDLFNGSATLSDDSTDQIVVREDP